MTTAPDMLKQFGGVPVASDKFAGWWGNDIWFVDYDNGVSTSQKGKNDIENPQKDLAQAITDARAGDTIYIRPRTTLGDRGTSATSIRPVTAANWTIPQATHHLSLIGTGTDSALENGVKLEGYEDATAPTITVIAPYVTFENIGFQGIWAGDPVNDCLQIYGLLTVQAFTPGAEDGYSCTVNHCNFHVYKPSVAGSAALVFDSGRYNQCLNSSFWHNYYGIKIASGEKYNHGNIIRNCDFWGAAGDVDADIRLADSDHVLIEGNRFHHVVPALTAGSFKKYIDFGGTSAKGVVINNYFGTNSKGFNDDNDVDALVDVGNISGGDTAWMTST